MATAEAHASDGTDGFASTVTLNECSKCGMLFMSITHAERHLTLPKCHGAKVSKRLCGIVKLSDDYVPSRKRQSSSAPPMFVHGNHNTAIGHVDTLQIIVVNTGGDVAKAGSPMESELICKAILENPKLRHMLRTIENAPSAIFHMTKGVAGPQVLRNVKMEGKKASELRTDGIKTTSVLRYCKDTAVKMVTELKRALAAVTDDSPLAVRQWAADVRASMHQKLCGDLDYVTALQLYCDASSKFYKLPQESKDAIAGGVRDIGRFIAETADF